MWHRRTMVEVLTDLCLSQLSFYIWRFHRFEVKSSWLEPKWIYTRTHMGVGCKQGYLGCKQGYRCCKQGCKHVCCGSYVLSWMESLLRSFARELVLSMKVKWTGVESASFQIFHRCIRQTVLVWTLARDFACTSPQPLECWCPAHWVRLPLRRELLCFWSPDSIHLSGHSRRSSEGREPMLYIRPGCRWWNRRRCLGSTWLFCVETICYFCIKLWFIRMLM